MPTFPPFETYVDGRHKLMKNNGVGGAKCDPNIFQMLRGYCLFKGNSPDYFPESLRRLYSQRSGHPVIDQNLEVRRLIAVIVLT